MERCKDSGTVRGLGIATLVLTALCLVTCLALVPLFGASVDYVDTHPDEIEEALTQSMTYSSSDADVTIDGSHIIVDGQDYDSVALVLGFITAFLGIIVVLNIVVLVGNILAIANAEKPKKLTAAFVFAIIGAVLCFCMGAWIRCILQIIMAVYISKVRTWGVQQEAAAAAQSGMSTGNYAASGNQDIPNVLR